MLGLVGRHGETAEWQLRRPPHRSAGERMFVARRGVVEVREQLHGGRVKAAELVRVVVVVVVFLRRGEKRAWAVSMLGEALSGSLAQWEMRFGGWYGRQEVEVLW